MSTAILLIVTDKQIASHYEDVIKQHGVDYDVAESLDDIYNSLRKKKYHGIMIDIISRVRMRATPEEKHHFRNVLELYPVANLRWDDENKKINYLLTVHYEGDNPLDFFLNEQCRYFTGRILRSSTRYAVQFNLLVGKSPDQLAAAPEKTVTIDVSKNGTFIFSCQDWNEDDPLWIIVKEFEDQSPIRCDIKWVLPWGEKMKYPGIGVAFEEISESQEAALLAKCR